MVNLNWALLWQKAKLSYFDIAVSLTVSVVVSLIIALSAWADMGKSAEVKATLLSRADEVMQSVLLWPGFYEGLVAIAATAFFAFGLGALIVSARILLYHQALLETT